MWWTHKWEMIKNKYFTINFILNFCVNAWNLIFKMYDIKNACTKHCEIVQNLKKYIY